MKFNLKTFLAAVLTGSVAIAGATRYVDVDQFRSSNHTKTWTPPATSDTLTGNTATQTLTNKSMDFTANTITNIPLNTSAVTGLLSIGNGGTGGATKTIGFNSLSPMTTTGDLIGFNGTNNVRVPVGTNGYVLTADSTQPTGWLWKLNAAGFANPMTTPGDMIYENSSSSPDRVPGNTSTTVEYLTQTGTGTTAGTPTWAPFSASNISTGQLPILYGGTGASTATGALTNLLPTQTGNTGYCLQTNGTTTSWAACSSTNGTVTSVGLTAPSWLSVSGSPVTTSGTLAVTAASGQAQNLFLATPNGTTGAVGLRAIVAADIPTLNQSTTGNAATATTATTATTAGNVTGVVAIANGGTGQTTQGPAFNALSPMTTAGDIIYGGTSGSGTRLGIGANTYVLTSNGSAPIWQPAATGFTNPMTTLGDMIYGAASGIATRFSGNTSTTKQFLTQTGTGSASAQPTWGPILAADVPTLNQNTTGTASNVTGTVAISNGGTGSTSFSLGAIPFSNASALISNVTHLFWDNTNYRLGIGTGAGSMSSPDSGITLSQNVSTLPAPPAGTYNLVHIGALDGVANSTLYDSFGGTAQYITRRADGTNASPSAIQSGDVLGSFVFLGYGATSYQATSAAKIAALATENWTDSTGAGSLQFYTRSSGTTGGSTSRMTIDQNGGVTISGLTSALPLRTSSAGLISNGAIGLATSDVSGTLPVSHGGTNLTAVGSTNQVLGTTTSGTTTWQNLTDSVYSSANYVQNPSCLGTSTTGITATGTTATVTGITTAGGGIFAAGSCQLSSTTVNDHIDFAVNNISAELGLAGQNCQVSLIYSGLGSNWQPSLYVNGTQAGTTTMTDTTAGQSNTVSFNVPCGSNSQLTTYGNTYTVRLTKLTTTSAILETAQTDFGLSTNLVTATNVTDWATYSAPLGAVTTAPTTGATPVGKYRRVGDSAEIAWTLDQTSSGSSAGSGVYLVPLPTSCTLDTTKATVSTASGGAGATNLGIASLSTSATINNTSANWISGWAWAYNTSSLSIGLNYYSTSNQGAPFSSSNFAANTSPLHVQLRATVPCSGWTSGTGGVSPAQANFGWTTFTPTLTGLGTVTNSYGYYKHNGQNMDLRFGWTSGTPTSTTAALALPNGLLGDPASLTSGTNLVGTGSSGGTLSGSFTVLASPSSNSLNFGLQTGSAGGTTAQAGNSLSLASQSFSYQASVPISGWIENGRAPTLTGSVTSNSTSAWRLESAQINSGCTAVTSESSSWISAVSSSGTGQCALTFPSGTFSQAPQCTIMAQGTSVSGGEIAFSYYTNTTTAFSYWMSQPGVGAQNRVVNIMCMGPR